MLNSIRNTFDAQGYSLCDFPIEFDGILTDQASYYLKDYDAIYTDVGDAGKKIGEAVTTEASVSIAQTLRLQFQTTDKNQAFLNATLLTVIVFLAILSAMLLYSLMLADVDEKTYEYGMLRALGFKKEHLVRHISLKSLGFSIPGLFFGIIVAMILNIGLRMLIFLKAKNYESYDLTPTSIWIGAVFGLVMPMISNYFPIVSAMGKNLRNSLDLNRRSKDEVGIKVERLEDVGISINQLMVSLILVFVGFSCYYLVPYTIYN